MSRWPFCCAGVFGGDGLRTSPLLFPVQDRQEDTDAAAVSKEASHSGTETGMREGEGCAECRETDK